MNGYLRREFVLRALAGSGAAFLTAAALVDVAGAQESDASRARAAKASRAAAGYFGGADDPAAKVGALYLRKLNADASPLSIVRIARNTVRIIERAPNEEKAFEALAAAVKRDFRSDRTVQIDGWILSRTEADLCALSLLRPSQQR
jgi:hypothetical protein